MVGGYHLPAVSALRPLLGSGTLTHPLDSPASAKSTPAALRMRPFQSWQHSGAVKPPPHRGQRETLAPASLERTAPREVRQTGRERASHRQHWEGKPGRHRPLLRNPLRKIDFPMLTANRSGGWGQAAGGSSSSANCFRGSSTLSCRGALGYPAFASQPRPRRCPQRSRASRGAGLPDVRVVPGTRHSRPRAEAQNMTDMPKP